jgi:hypothetical protein
VRLLLLDVWDAYLKVVLPSPEIISTTTASLFAERMTQGERTNFWDEKDMRNVDPFVGEDPNGFFTMPWDIKVRLLNHL